MSTTQTPDTLFARWAKQRWNPTTIDLANDVLHASSLDEHALIALHSYTRGFLIGEQLVTDTLAPILYAAPEEDERRYLATQIADEAVHSVFFHRVCDQIFKSDAPVKDLIGPDGLKPGTLFWQLAQDVERVRVRPSDMSAWVQAVTTYHLLVEGFLAIDAQRKMVAFFKQHKVFPGFAEGLKAIARDESRHIMFGVLALKRRVAGDAKHIETIKSRAIMMAPRLMLLTVGNNGFLPGAADAKQTSVITQLSRRLKMIGFSATDISAVTAAFQAADPTAPA